MVSEYLLGPTGIQPRDHRRLVACCTRTLGPRACKYDIGLWKIAVTQPIAL